MIHWGAFLTVTYFSFLLVVIYTLICGESDFHRNGIIGWFHRFLTYECWVHIRRSSQRVFGRGCFGYVDNAQNYCCNRRNPFLQLLYLFFVFGGWALFYFTGFDYIPGPFIAAHHKLFLSIACCYTGFHFMWACSLDPGVITASNQHEYAARYKYDDILYSKKMCDTCKIVKPARSKHCRICNKCVARFDHHCAWMNTDVGQNNLKHFLLFLLNTSALTGYAAWMCWQIVRGVVAVNKLTEMTYKDAQGVSQPLSWPHIISFVMYHLTPTVGLGIFCAIVCVMLFGFWAYHMYLIYNNCTTNESFKWKDIRWSIEQARKQRAKMIEDEKRGVPVDKKNGPDPKVLDAALKLSKTDLSNRDRKSVV